MKVIVENEGPRKWWAYIEKPTHDAYMTDIKTTRKKALDALFLTVEQRFKETFEDLYKDMVFLKQYRDKENASNGRRNKSKAKRNPPPKV